jgi:sulfopyruvate decarboxylase TPP-binding subunit
MNKLLKKLCSCIKQVQKTIKLRPSLKQIKKAKESAAIGICVKSVLQTRGRTLKKFSCKKKILQTKLL